MTVTAHTLTRPIRRIAQIAVATLALVTTLALAQIPAPAPPTIAARSHILIDFDSGQTLAEGNADTAVEPASLTKLMTAYVAFGELKVGHLKLTDTALVSEKAWRTPGSRTFVEVGKQIPIETLMLGMIVQSGNDATIAVAERIAGSEEVFANMMNKAAEELGMTKTHFTNSTGLPDQKHYTTARDLAKLARSIIRDFPEYYRWYSLKEFTYNGITQPNRNLLLARDKSVDGIKTGHTESAGYCLIASAMRNNMRLVSVVIGTKSENARAQESQSLLNFGFGFFETHRLYGAHEALTKSPVYKGDIDEISLGLQEPLFITIPRGEYNNLKAKVNVTPKILAPVSQGQELGNVAISLHDTPVAERPLTALSAIAEGGIVHRFADEVRLFFK